MRNKTYDIVIVWAWPAWLFCASKLWNSHITLILEWNDSPAKKLLMSAKWRWNITNININPITDYVTDDKNFVINAFKQYWINDFISFLNREWIETNEENNWRIFLKSNKVSEFHQKLIQLVTDKWIEIQYNIVVNNIKIENNLFKINTSSWEFKSKKIIIATWWPSFPNLGASWIAVDIAKSFYLDTTEYYPALVWFETKQDFSTLSWSSVIWKLSLLYKWKILYEEEWPILFTHRWLSWPVIFNASLFLRFANTSSYKIKLKIPRNEMTKRLLNFLKIHSNNINEYIISSDIVKVRWLEEAKVCWWWVKTDNIKTNFECKNIKWLYFIWECIDVTGKTWWFNLQWCRTSAAICANWINSGL